MRFVKILFIIVLSTFFIQGCKSTEEGFGGFTSFGTWDDLDIGAVTIFTRISNPLPDDSRQLLFDIYKNYGSVSFQWVDEEHKQVDVLVKGAPLEWAPSFVQENIELVEKKLIYWRMDEIWYRANFQLYTITFPFRGKINPDASLYLDTGMGWDSVELEKDGSFEVMLPFSVEKTIVFAKIELLSADFPSGESTNVIRYKRINIVNNTIDEITEQEYQTERNLYSKLSEDDENNQEPGPIDDYTPPELPEPEINVGPTDEWFELDKNVEPKLEGHLTKKDETKEKKPDAVDKTDGTVKKEKPEEKPIVLPNRKGSPPKTLERPISYRSIFVIKGLLPTDSIKTKLINVLESYNLLKSYYDEIEEAYIFEFDALTISDIKRIHNALSEFSKKESLQMSNSSRYFCVQMTPLQYDSELRTQITGTVLPGTVVQIFAGPGKPEYVAEVDEDGNFKVDIPLPAGTSFVYGKKIFNNVTSYFQVSVLTGKTTEITKNQYDLAIKEITETLNKLAK